MNPTHNQGSPKEQVFNLLNGTLHERFGKFINTYELRKFKLCAIVTYAITRKANYTEVDARTTSKELPNIKKAHRNDKRIRT